MNRHSAHCKCMCSGNPASFQSPFGVSRREFLYSVGALSIAGLAGRPGEAALQGVAPKRGPKPLLPLRVQPVLTYEIPKRREATSWRNWGGIQTEEGAVAEKNRIGGELSDLSTKTGFPLEVLPTVTVLNLEQAATVARGSYDVLLLYAAGGGVNILETLTVPGKWNVMFLRHDPGPVYLWYEIAHNRFLRKTVDDYGQPGWDVHDVVVDDYSEILWRLRALSGLKNTLGKKIVAVGGAAGWGKGGQTAPARTRELWKMELVDYPYKDLAKRIQDARRNSALVERCAREAQSYLDRGDVSLQTTQTFVNNAFLLTEVLKDVMDDAQTDAITINSCMGTIMPMSETTACLPLSLMNDDGYLAFCESDFVVIPSGILLHYISGKPVFLNDPTFPHGNLVTLAHCTAPRKMDGTKAEPAKILTHFESDYGAAPKVEMKIGQTCTTLVPDFASKSWVGFEGTIVGNPFLDICRSQVEVRVHGDSNALLEEMKGFHWMLSYGSYLRETGYALGKVGVRFHNVSAVQSA
ncbi:MAG TPA: sugar isomerase [Acidobacteriota bacterium]|nr:sugar isomerase [Acidobacteriota bacterium]